MAQENGEWRYRDRINSDRGKVHSETPQVFKEIVSFGSKHEPFVTQEGYGNIDKGGEHISSACHHGRIRWKKANEQPSEENEAGVPKNRIPDTNQYVPQELTGWNMSSKTANHAHDFARFYLLR